MDKQLTPIQRCIKLFKKYYNFYSEGSPKKEAYKEVLDDLQIFLEIEKQFAEKAFDCHPQNSTFTEYYKQYEDEKDV